MIVTAAGVLLLGGSVFYFTLRRAQQ
jgi:hypothetical protein